MAGVKEFKTHDIPVEYQSAVGKNSIVTNTDGTHSLQSFSLPGKVLITHPKLDFNTLYIELLMFTKYAFTANYKPLKTSPMSN